MATGTKILGFHADGVRKLHAVELAFAEKGLTQIKGKNKQGKSTVLDTIEWLIRGNKVLDKSAKNPEKEKAEAEIILGDYKIKRVMRDKSNALEVRNVKTNEIEKGEVQLFLDTFINELTFNPRALADLTKVEKYKFCMKLYNIDFTEIDKEIQTLEQDRLLTGREVKRFGEIEPVEEVKRIDVQELLSAKKVVENENSKLRAQYDKDKQDALQAILSFNKEQQEKAKKLEDEEDRYSALQKDLKFNLDKIEELKKQIAELEADNEQIKFNIEDSKKKLAALPEPEPEKELKADIPQPGYQSTSELEEQIQNALLINKKAEIYEDYLKRRSEKSAKQEEYEALDGKINNLREKKLEILRNIDTKVEGLEIGTDDIYYKGIGSDNWSDSERIRITSELCVAMMPNLRAIFIDGLEEMDSDSISELQAWAVEHDIQVIATMVANEPDKEPADNCFFIVNGEVK